MSDLISRQAAIDAMSESLKRVFPEHRQIAEKCLNALPSAQLPVDAVPVIRCKDCKYHDYGRCAIWEYCKTEDDYFCKDGEREENEEDR